MKLFLGRLVGTKLTDTKVLLKCRDKPHREPTLCNMNYNHQQSDSMNVSVTASTRATVLVVVESYISILLDVATLVGNSLVCLAFYRNPSLRTVTNYFVLSLALTDLSMAVLVMPWSTTLTITNWIGNELSCKLYYFCLTILAGVSLATVMLLAINRYFRVVQPALYTKIFSKKRSVGIAVSVWVVTIVLTTVVEFATMKQPQNFPNIESVSSCFKFIQKTVLPKHYGIISIIFIAVPSVTIVACYIKIYQTIRQHNTAAAPSSQEGHSSYGVEEAKITRMLTVVVVGFYLCWLPPLISNILLALDSLGETAIKYWNFYFTFPLFASSVINPVAYGTMCQSFRDEFMKILRRQP